MTMGMKLNEVFPLDGLNQNIGIFAIFRKLYPDEFDKFFDKLTPLPLDMYFIGTYGERTVTPLVESIAKGNTSYDGTLMVIFSMHMQSWLKSYEALFTDYSPFDNYKLTETHKGTTTNEGDNTSDSLDSIQSFDSTDFKDTDKTTNNSKSNNVETQDIVITKTGNIGNTVNSDLISKQLWAYRSKLIQIIFADIRDYMTLQLYD